MFTRNLAKTPLRICTALKTSNAFGLFVYLNVNRNLLRLELIEIWMLPCVQLYIPPSRLLTADVQYWSINYFWGPPLMMWHDFDVKLTPTPPLFTFYFKSNPPFQNDIANLWFSSQAMRKWIAFRRWLALFKAKTLTSPYYFTNKKHHKKCTQFRPAGNGYDSPPSTYWSVAGKLPNWKFYCFTMHFDLLNLTHTNQCTSSYIDVSVF
jgi:hypothetical protein